MKSVPQRYSLSSVITLVDGMASCRGARWTEVANVFWERVSIGHPDSTERARVAA
jgi:hypothetical protein